MGQRMGIESGILKQGMAPPDCQHQRLSVEVFKRQPEHVRRLGKAANHQVEFALAQLGQQRRVVVGVDLQAQRWPATGCHLV